MELTLEDVSAEFAREVPNINIVIDDDGQIHLRTHGFWPVDATKLLYSAIGMLDEDLDDEDREELARWATED